MTYQTPEIVAMVVESTRLRILDPTVEALPDTTLLAVRPHDLHGKVIGLLSNGKRNADTLLDTVYILLQASYRLGGFVRASKEDASRPAPQLMVDDLLEQCDLVITATGD